MTEGPNSARAAFTHRPFRFFIAARFLAVVAVQMQGVAVAWDVARRTNDPLGLAFVGLAQFIPFALLALPSGLVADRKSRRGILLACHATYSLCGVLLLVIARTPNASVGWIYAVLVIIGAGRSFAGPAGSALVPSLVSDEHFKNAVAWSSSTWQLATIAGPSLGGFLASTVFGTRPVYMCAAALQLSTFVLLLFVRPRIMPRGVEIAESPAQRVLAGVRYIRANRVLLGAVSLDLFAVLLGGAVALLPFFAKDILHVGAQGLGLLRAAPAAGAAVVAMSIAAHPIERNAGRAMFIAVSCFGIATLAFGLSRHFALSLAALFAVGATDMISVYVRQTLIQLRTPDEMRGRVSAVNQIFIGASNELGEFESGVTAKWLGVTRAVIFGGIGTLCVTGLWAVIFPELRKVSSVEDRK